MQHPERLDEAKQSTWWSPPGMDHRIPDNVQQFPQQQMSEHKRTEEKHYLLDRVLLYMRRRAVAGLVGGLLVELVASRRPDQRG